MRDESIGKLLSVNAAAERLGCGVKTLRRWLAEGAVPAVAINPPGRRRKSWRIPEGELVRLLRERMRGVPEATEPNGGRSE